VVTRSCRGHTRRPSVDPSARHPVAFGAVGTTPDGPTCHRAWSSSRRRWFIAGFKYSVIGPDCMSSTDRAAARGMTGGQLRMTVHGQLRQRNAAERRCCSPEVPGCLLRIAASSPGLFLSRRRRRRDGGAYLRNAYSQSCGYVRRVPLPQCAHQLIDGAAKQLRR
jgi:hypothetical protein